MAEVLDRNRLYALISATEADLRALIRAQLLTDDLSIESVLGANYPLALERMFDDQHATTSGADVVDYLDLGDEIAVLQRHRLKLPTDIRNALQSSAQRLESLIPIRNRVMHTRPLLPDDYDNVRRWLEDLDKGGFTGEELRAVLAQVRVDPNWTPPGVIPNLESSTLNNLPIPEYDETGLVGRRRQVDEVKRLLLSGKYPVITLTGPGGVGKTSLALQVLHELAEDANMPFELIAWVSLKTEHLTAAGVQNIRDAVRSLEDALPRIASPLDDSFYGGIEELAVALEGVQTLLAIDNLETVSGDEIVALVDALPVNVRCFFTSRVGLGQIDRRVQIQPLDANCAVDLLRRMARARGIEHVARMKKADIEKVVDVLGNSPLAIKWFTLALEAGQSPSTILHQQQHLVNFCVRNVYESLSREAKDLAVVLGHVQRPLTLQDLSLYKANTPDDLRRNVQELLQRSLCLVSMVEDSLTEQFEATEPLTDYLRFAGGQDQGLIEDLKRADGAYRREEERLRIERERTPLRVNVISGVAEHRAVALRLREALRTSKAGDVHGALELINDLKALDPEYWEIHRVEAFLHSQNGQLYLANSAYDEALRLAPDEREKARVHFFYSGHLSRRLASDQALHHARIAHTLLQRPETALELARIVMYNRDYQAALGLLDQAAATEDVRGRLIAGTQTVDCLKRRAEMEANELRSPEVALRTLADAVELGAKLLSDGLRDRRLETQLYSCVTEALAIAYRQHWSDATELSLRPILRVVESLSSPVASKTTGHLTKNCERLLGSHALPDDISATLESIIRNADTLRQDEDPGTGGPAVPTGTELLGRLKAWKQTYGFIASVEGDIDYFFHVSDLIDPVERLFLIQGTTLLFTPSRSEGRPRAVLVGLSEPADQGKLGGRILDVKSKREGYLWAADRLTATNVFVGKHVITGPDQWASIDSETVLLGDLEIDGDARVAARSARFWREG